MVGVEERYKYVCCKERADCSSLLPLFTQDVAFAWLALLAQPLAQYSCIAKWQPAADVQRKDGIAASSVDKYEIFLVGGQQYACPWLSGDVTKLCHSGFVFLRFCSNQSFSCVIDSFRQQLAVSKDVRERQCQMFKANMLKHENFRVYLWQQKVHIFKSTCL